MGRLDHLELFNFKSYGGRVVVGPFKDFTAIIGTNGSGKSNLMDAISFVLGVRTSQLRGNQLRDLVYRNTEDPNDKAADRKAHVKLVYVDGPVKITFLRGVTLSGSSEYKVDGKSVSMEAYNTKLGSISVCVKARNFLVFQNEVEGIASKSPKDLTAMFEDISESAELRESYDAARTEKEAAEETVMFYWRKRKGMAAERRQYKEQKEEAEKYRTMRDDLTATKKELALFRLFHIDAEHSACQKDIEEHTSALAELEGNLNTKGSSVDSVTAEINNLERKKTQLQSKLKRVKAELEKLQPIQVKFETEVSSLTRRLKGDENKLSKAEQESETRVSNLGALEEELRSVSESVAQIEKELSKFAGSVRGAGSGNPTGGRGLQRAVVDWKVIEAQIEAARTRLQAYSNDARTYRDRASELSRLRIEASSELRKMEDEHGRALEVESERDLIRSQLERTVNETTQALRDAKADSENSSHRRRFDEVLANMNIRGVRGRLSELCKPTQDRYKVAVEVVFGKLMDAIVVDNERIAAECISYLKERQAGVATFIPLADVRPRPVDERLRRIGGTARLVIDVVTHDEEYTPAVLYASGNSVVCDTLDEARAIRYDGGRRIKVCSLDGTLINRAGFMTGGAERDSRQRRNWATGIDQIRQKRASAQRELAALGEVSHRRIAAERIERIDGTRRKISYLENDYKEALLSAERAEADSGAARAELDEMEKAHPPEMREQLKAFSVTSPSKEPDGGEEDLLERKLELETRQSRLTSQIKYERSKDYQAVVSGIQRRLADQGKKLEISKGNLENLGIKRGEMEERAERLFSEIQSISQELDDKADALGEARRELGKDRSSIGEKRKIISRKKAVGEQLLDRRQRLLTECEVNDLILVEGAIDYSTLSRKNRMATSADAQNEIVSGLEDKMQTLENQLEKLAPNMRANEHMADVSSRLSELDREADAARDRAKNALEAFENIKEDRHSRFVQCFTHVADKISDVYKQLTKSDSYPMGGTAHLSVEQQEEPYLSGVKFTAMPPTKRYRDMEQLSGGERTVAALALLFAIHDYKPSPFFILDEVDAALDSGNVSRVSSYVQSRAPDLQTIVITLKDAFFEKADALVGIYRDSSVNASRLLTLDLSNFDEPDRRADAGVAAISI
jgi:structural maintenance of chromosome 1